MQAKAKWIAGAAVTTVLVAGIGGIAVASGGGDGGDDQPITGDAYDRATSVALDEVGSGQVTETEMGDEESYYQVEITKPDGTQVDVNLDEQFNVVKTKAEGADDDSDEGPDTDPNEPGHQD